MSNNNTQLLEEWNLSERKIESGEEEESKEQRTNVLQMEKSKKSENMKEVSLKKKGRVNTNITQEESKTTKYWINGFDLKTYSTYFCPH